MDGQQREPNGAPGIAEDLAFVDSFEVGPTGSGTLDGLSFAVKDLIDIGGHVTGCGNPDWRDTHAPAAANAVCVEQLGRSGSRALSTRHAPSESRRSACFFGGSRGSRR